MGAGFEGIRQNKVHSEKIGVITQNNNGVIDPFVKGSGDSRYLFAFWPGPTCGLGLFVVNFLSTHCATAKVLRYQHV